MTVEIVDLESIAWTEVSDDWPGKVATGEPDVQYKPFTLGSALVPGGQLVEYEPGHVEAPHSHSESELFFIVAGDLRLGDREITTGTVVHIPGGTVYSTVAGPQGTRFLRLHVET
jgi:quercetin dioxygenase-like cupin family protein